MITMVKKVMMMMMMMMMLIVTMTVMVVMMIVMACAIQVGCARHCKHAVLNRWHGASSEAPSTSCGWPEHAGCNGPRPNATGQLPWSPPEDPAVLGPL